MSEANKAAATAIGPMLIAAAERYLPRDKRIVDDPLAADMLSGSGKIFASLCKYAPIRKALLAISEIKGPGVWGGILCRKRYIDDKVQEAVASGIGALVILGAGFDTRGCRLAAPAGVPSFELDLPGNINAKRGAIEKAMGLVPEKVSLVPVDFENSNLAAALADAGYDAESKTLFVWEGVTQYLTEPAVRKSLDFLAGAPIGSRLAFTYVLKDFIEGKDMHDSEATYRQLVEGAHLWHFGLMPDALEALLVPYGWHLVEDVGAEDHRINYLEPSGRTMKVMEIERIAFAEKSR